MAAISETTWQASALMAAGTWINPAAGYWHYTEDGGTTDSSEPTWSTTPGGTTSDNTVTWTCFKLFPLTPDFTFSRTSSHKTIINRSISGYEQRIARGSIWKKFQCQFTNRSDTDASTLETFFVDHDGQTTGFVFYDPDGDAYYCCRFDGEDFTLGKDAPAAVKSFSCNLQEVNP